MKFNNMFFNRVYYIKNPSEIDKLTNDEIKLLLSTCSKSISFIEIFSLAISISSIFIASMTAVLSNRVNIILNSISTASSEKRLNMNNFLDQMNEMANNVQNKIYMYFAISLFIGGIVIGVSLYYSYKTNTLKINLKKVLISRGVKI